MPEGGSGAEKGVPTGGPAGPGIAPVRRAERWRHPSTPPALCHSGACTGPVGTGCWKHFLFPGKVMV